MPAEYRLGCPIWANRAWVGNLYASGAKADEFLAQYASVFDAVEGNSSFYALPSESSVDRWKQQTPESFRFCFKFSRTITHDKMLVGAEAETAALFDRLGPLEARLGPFLLQLSASFGPQRLPALDRYLAALPADFSYAVEVRHLAFFDGGAQEARLDAILRRHHVARCNFDTRPLFATKNPDAITVATQGRKPRVPPRATVCGDRPFMRFVGQNDVRATSGWLMQLAEQIGTWLDAGLTPYVFMHAPDDFYAPRHARALHHLVGKVRPVEPLAGFRGESQLSMFTTST